MTGLLARLACLLHGHEDVLQQSAARLVLVCLTCHRETPGWTLDLPRPVPRYGKLLRFNRRLAATAQRSA